MRARIEVVLKQGVFDPQGKVLVNALHHLEYSNVSGVRAGKVFYVALDETDKVKATEKLNQMTDQLFANPVIEDYTIELLDE